MTVREVVTIVAVALSSVSCMATRELGSNVLDVACTAQRYMSTNGFLNDPVSDVDRLDLQTWDRLRFERDGTMDWSALLAQRQGIYTDRIYGVMREADNFVVLYKIDANYTCLDISADLASVYMHEAACTPTRPVTRVMPRQLECP